MQSIINLILRGISLFIEDPNVLIFVSLIISALIFFIHLGFIRGPLPFRLTLFNPMGKNAFTAWATPLTGTGGILGIILVVHNNGMFADLSLFFGALVLAASFLYQVIQPYKTLTHWVGAPVSAIVTLWAVIGEIVASAAMLVNLNLSSHLMTLMFRWLVAVVGALLLMYLLKEIIHSLVEKVIQGSISLVKGWRFWLSKLSLKALSGKMNI